MNNGHNINNISAIISHINDKLKSERYLKGCLHIFLKTDLKLREENHSLYGARHAHTKSKYAIIRFKYVFRKMCKHPFDMQ